MFIVPVRRQAAISCLLAAGLVAAAAPAVPPLAAQTLSTPTAAASPDAAYRKHFVGSSLFVLGNLLPEPPDFFQLNYGYRLTPRDALSVEVITWKYHAPLGIPYGPSYESPDERYAGSVREFGIGLAYQRLLWKGLYSSAHALPLVQRYSNEEGERIQNGFQLFLTARLGYQVSLFSGRWFLEPSVAATAWPINTNVPDAFAAAESKWPRYFLFEPGLHFGRRF
ncbi:MAG: hypothetical protein M3483_03320 [Gemmatimonadota bacterium]|nr:hypothetical protein [Gemmatimonadota bacterium]